MERFDAKKKNRNSVERNLSTLFMRKQKKTDCLTEEENRAEMSRAKDRKKEVRTPETKKKSQIRTEKRVHQEQPTTVESKKGEKLLLLVGNFGRKHLIT
ncbi:hypothetical protein TNIN_429401 [Trichonephila inaurata madagascariensis]|uniref:Uncharacterized protein n=1 Tax=Trichonephila inaurata madagascariensis TaxID=2747483 RepID=A0A8X7BT59_9ARAC|nr:hypothetical protein TNIN_429401 [Trichonephila inaurata madagascariensis]